MKCNVGGTDRIIRIILGVVVILAGFYFKSWWGVVGILLIVTGLIKFCPAYIPFGFSTCKPDKK